jgi:CubicO group peptidase (beta-lactamase class C family)
MPLAGLLAAVLAAAALGAFHPALAGQSVADQVDKVFAAWNRKDSPGCSVGVAQGGVPVLLRGYGMANLEYDVPITADTIFEAGSVSKQFTAGAVHLLALDGRLSLDDPASRYLPELPEAAKGIRLRHLLTHTSGLRSQWPLLTLAGRPPGEAVHSIPEILSLVSRQHRLNFEPGDDFLYNNTAFTLLSVVVSRVSGQSFQQFCDARLFKPIGMTSTRWRDDYTQVVRNRATAYRQDGDGRFHTAMSFTNVVGNGGLLTTVKDLLAWNQNLDTGEVGGRQWVEALHTRGRLNDGFVTDYAQGLYVRSFRGVREVSHSGSTAGYRAFLARYPEQRLSVAVLCNLAGTRPDRLGREVAGLYLGPAAREPPSPPAAEVPPDTLHARAGLYRDPVTDEVLRFTVFAGTLRLGVTDLRALSPQRFLAPDGPEYEFATDGSGATLVRLLAAGARPRTYVAVPAARPTPADLAAFAGRYFSDELETFYTVAVEKDGLVVRRQWERWVLQPAYADAFEMDGDRLVRFTRETGGHVDGFDVFADRIRHVHFERVGVRPLVRRP